MKAGISSGPVALFYQVKNLYSKFKKDNSVWFGCFAHAHCETVLSVYYFIFYVILDT